MKCGPSAFRTVGWIEAQRAETQRLLFRRECWTSLCSTRPTELKKFVPFVMKLSSFLESLPPRKRGRESRISKNDWKQTGVTLVELVAFIVVSALLATGLIATFTSAMRDTPKSGDITQALQLAQERMELILAYKQAKGFNALVDPCTITPPTQCTNFPSGFSVTTPATIINNWNGSAEFKEIRVDITGPQSLTLRLTALVASY